MHLTDVETVRREGKIPQEKSPFLTELTNAAILRKIVKKTGAITAIRWTYVKQTHSFPWARAVPIFNMASSLHEKSSTESLEEHTEKKAIDSSKRVEKAKRIKQQLLNAQAQKSVVEERKTTSISKTDLTTEEKQNMENFFEWSPPPPPETMGEKLGRKFKQNPLVPVGKYSCVL